MSSPRKTILAAGVAAASALVLAGCAAPAATPSTTDGAESSTITVVASTSVYAQIAEAIVGDAATVTAIVSSTSQDPHEYEATAQDQLALADADLIIENGGGYDAFVDTLIEATGSTAPVITAVEHSHDWPENAGHSEEAEEDHDHEHGDHGDHEHVEGFNEHVWYDPHTIVHVAEAIAAELSELLPEDADAIAGNLETFAAGIEELEAQLAAVAEAHGGEEVLITEPVAGYLVAAAGLVDATPEGFSAAVEGGQDVPPAVLLDTLNEIESGHIKAVIANAQTGGAETTRVIEAAGAGGIPVVEFTETLPEGQTYLQWMQSNIEALQGALQE